MKTFLETVNYTSCNEDSRSEIEALQINQGDKILCISGSGARSLDLLTEKPATIVSIDMNHCQSYLLELKIVAIQHLDYQQFVDFIGICPSKNRAQVYQSIRPSLSLNARGFWDKHVGIIKKGVIYQGRWERYFRLLAHVIGLARPRLREKLFCCRCIEEQTDIWIRKWDNLLWRTFLHCISAKWVWELLFGDPGFYRYVPDDFSIYRYLSEKFATVGKNVLLRNSPFANLLFYGKYNANGMLPPHLQRKNYSMLKNNVSRIHVITGSLTDFLSHCTKACFHKYSLSDFASYTTEKEHVKIWKEIDKTAADNALICERQFLVKRKLPFNIKNKFTQNIILEKRLSMVDDSIFYTFVIAKKETNNNDRYYN
ncbi:MAG: DUF3419 family protein [bacterium]